MWLVQRVRGRMTSSEADESIQMPKCVRVVPRNSGYFGDLGFLFRVMGTIWRILRRELHDQIHIKKKKKKTPQLLLMKMN